MGTPTDAAFIKRVKLCIHSLVTKQSGLSLSQIRAAADSIHQDAIKATRALPESHPSAYLSSINRNNNPHQPAATSHESLAAAVLRIEASVNRMTRAALNAEKASQEQVRAHSTAEQAHLGKSRL